jgi:hypothetical protein
MWPAVSLTRALQSIRSVELDFDGIFCEDTKHAIQFSNDPDDQTWRQWRRRGEVAKTVQRLLAENSYRDRSLDVSYRYRYYATRADQSRIRRYARQFLLEWVWGYGVKILRPLVTWTLVVLLFAVIYGMLPALNSMYGVSFTDIPLHLYEGGTITLGQAGRLSGVFVSGVKSFSVW